MTEITNNTKLVYVTTVPETLKLIAGQLSYMKSHGLEVHVLTSSGDLLEEFGHKEQVYTHCVKMLRKISPIQDCLSLWHVCRELRRICPHIVHSNTAKGGLLGMLAGWITRVPVRVYHVHGLRYVTMSGFGRIILKSTEKIACKLAHQVLCVSNSVMDMTISEGICPSKKIKVLHGGSVNGIDSNNTFNPALQEKHMRASVRARYGIPEDAIVAGFVGRVVRDKGLVELVEAFHILRSEYPNLHLLIVGPFEDGDLVPSETEHTLRTDQKIHLVGLEWNTPPLYKAMDIFVFPSYREGLGVVALEASAMELPVVATRIPGCVDAVEDTTTGILVAPKDSIALAEAIKTYIDNPNLREIHGKAGRKRVLRKFCQEDIWTATFQEYAHLLANVGIHLSKPYSKVMSNESNAQV